MYRILPFFLLLAGFVFSADSPGEWILSQLDHRVYVNPNSVREFEGQMFLIIDDKVIATSGIGEDDLGLFLLRPAENDIILGTRDYRLLLCRECRTINDLRQNQNCRTCGIDLNHKK
jgi:hypothetical protein